MKPKLIIIGGGGHGKVVAEAAIGSFNITGFADDEMPQGSEIIKGIKVISSTKEIGKIKKSATYFLIAIGNNHLRRNLFKNFATQMKPAVIIHPSAIVSKNSAIGIGSVILANTVVNSGVQVGENCIVNALALIDHDTNIGNHSHISQGTIIGSNCNISEVFTSELGQRIKSFSTI